MRCCLPLIAAILLAACASPRPVVTPAPAPAPAPRPAAPPAATSAPAPAPPITPAVPPQPGRGGYYKDDGPGEAPPADLAAIPDATPRAEPLHPRANRPYVALGQSFTPQDRVAPYRARGIASWYGRRFHGKPTSSGEPYNMYAMTAAHPTLPIPSYVRVTHTGNGRSVVVRINDRGPFLRGRIIDLSYTAAWKLGYIQQGSAEVEVEAILPENEAPPAQAGAAPAVSSASPAVPANPMPSLTAPLPPGPYLQLGAFGSRRNAEGFRDFAAQELKNLREPLHIIEDGERFRLQLGPFASVEAARAMSTRVASLLKLTPFLVQR